MDALITTATRRQRASLARPVSTRLQTPRHAVTVVLDWQTWIVTLRLSAVRAQLGRMLRELGAAAMFAHLVRLIWTRMHRLCVMRAVWASSRRLGLLRARLVLRAGLTRTLTHPQYVVHVRPARSRRLMRLDVPSVQLVRLTWTLMRPHRALCAHRATTLVLARRRALHVQLVRMTMMMMRALHVCCAV